MVEPEVFDAIDANARPHDVEHELIAWKSKCVNGPDVLGVIAYSAYIVVYVLIDHFVVFPDASGRFFLELQRQLVEKA